MEYIIFALIFLLIGFFVGRNYEKKLKVRSATLAEMDYRKKGYDQGYRDGFNEGYQERSYQG